MKILNFGSLNLDYVYSVDHFVRPGETLTSQSREVFCGGKGLNQSIAFAKAGARVYHAGRIGTDGMGLKEMLQGAGVRTDFIVLDDGPSGHTIIQVDKNGQNCILLYGGANRKITEQQVEEVLTHFQEGDLLILQNEINNLPFIMDRAYKKGLDIVLNPSPADDHLLSLPLEKVKYFLLNEIEGEMLSGHSEPDEILDLLHRRYPYAKIVLTLGKRGAMYYDGGQRYSHGIYDVPVVDTTGAGDTFTGYFIGMLAAGESVQNALRIASKASALAITVKGAANAIPVLNKVLSSDLCLAE